MHAELILESNRSNRHESFPLAPRHQCSILSHVNAVTAVVVVVVIGLCGGLYTPETSKTNRQRRRWALFDLICVEGE